MEMVKTIQILIDEVVLETVNTNMLMSWKLKKNLRGLKVKVTYLIYDKDL